MADNPVKGKSFPNHCRSYADWRTDDRAIVWFDIDNTLYSASTRISHAMGERIHGNHLVALQCVFVDFHPSVFCQAWTVS